MTFIFNLHFVIIQYKMYNSLYICVAMI